MTLLEQWRTMDARRRTGLFAGVGVILLIVAGASFFLLQPRYVPVFPDLSPQDSATLVTQLEAAKTPYRVDASTGAIVVPDDEAAKVRATVASRGFPLKNAVGFELFDGGDFGMTEFTEKINYRRALEGELARTIMSLDSVRFARLHLVLPESSLFKRDRDPPKASVLVVTVADRKVTPEQVAGIQRLVSSAVPGLAPEMVSVHDHRGINLAEGGGDGTTPTGITAKESTEAYLSSKVYQMLGALYPKTSLSVSVDATLRSGRMTSTHEAQSGTAQHAATLPVKARHVPMRDNADDAQLAAEDGPIPPRTVIPPAATSADTTLDRTTEQSEESPGQIERLSVAVILPDPLPANTSLEEVRDLVTAAVGAEVARGDRVAVYSMKMPLRNLVMNDHLAGQDASKSVLPKVAATGENLFPNIQWILFFGLAIVYLLVLGFVLRRPGRVVELSRSEREALVTKVKLWLNEPDPVAGVRR